VAASEDIRGFTIKRCLVASGLKWTMVGATKLTQGRELSNSELATALKSKSQFRQQEWEALGISDLGPDDFIKVDGFYFRPSDVVGYQLPHPEEDLATMAPLLARVVDLVSVVDPWLICTLARVDTWLEEGEARRCPSTESPWDASQRKDTFLPYEEFEDFLATASARAKQRTSRPFAEALRSVRSIIQRSPEGTSAKNMGANASIAGLKAFMSPSKETFWMCSECIRLDDKSEAHVPRSSLPSCQQCAPTFVDESWLLRHKEARHKSSLDQSMSPLRHQASSFNSSVSPLQKVYRSRTSLLQRDGFLNSSVDSNFMSEEERPAQSPSAQTGKKRWLDNETVASSPERALERPSVSRASSIKEALEVQAQSLRSAISTLRSVARPSQEAAAKGDK